MKIIYENEEIEVVEGTTIKEALYNQMEKSNVKDIIAAKLDNSIESLNLPLTQGGKLEFISRVDKVGRMIYIRGLLFIMSKAFFEEIPDAL